METVVVNVNSKTKAIEVKSTQTNVFDDVALLISAAVKLYAQAKGIGNDDSMNSLALDLMQTGKVLGERYAK